MTAESPIVGKGPDHFPLLVQNYPVEMVDRNYFPQGKDAHTLWLQIMAELGVPGVLFLASFYLLVMIRLWPFIRRDLVDGMGVTDGAVARMVWAALVGFSVSAQFVSLEGLELPYYIAITGLGMLKVSASSIDTWNRPQGSIELPGPSQQDLEVNELVEHVH